MPCTNRLLSIQPAAILKNRLPFHQQNPSRNEIIHIGISKSPHSREYHKVACSQCTRKFSCQIDQATLFFAEMLSFAAARPTLRTFLPRPRAPQSAAIIRVVFDTRAARHNAASGKKAARHQGRKKERKNEPARAPCSSAKAKRLAY